MKKYINKNNIFTICLIFFASVLFYKHYIRIFDNNFWGDEAYTIRLSKMSFSEMIHATAGDVHPPLYYIIVQILCKIFGFHDYVYHLSSLIPYFLILLVSLTTIRKKWGIETAAILIAFVSLLDHSIQYAVEARMYEWGALFILLAYIELYNIIEYNQTKNYILFTIWGLCAAYTHYYCLVSVTFFYAAILLYMMLRKNFNLKMLLLTYGVTIICYLPWSYHLLKSFRKTSSDYWIEECPDIKECFRFLFDSRYHQYFNAVLIIVFLLVLLFELKLLILKNNTKKFPIYTFNIHNLAFTNFTFFIIIGFISIIGTMLGGITVSALFRPMFITRYLYPVSIVAWLLIGICISRYKYKLIYSIIIVLLICSTGFKEYNSVYSRETEQNDRLAHTLEMTRDIYENQEDCILLSDKHALKWTVLEYYYPGFERDMIDISTLAASLPKDKSSWLFLTEELADDYVGELANKGYQTTHVLSNGHLGDIDVYIYYVSISN